MKHFKILLFLSLIFTSKTATCQFETMFGDTSTSWNILFGACDSWCSFSMETNGDTLINANTYKVLSSDWETVFLREDTTQGKVWFYDNSANNEYLLMDLNLVVGDNFGIFNPFTTQMDFFPVDSVYYFNNKKHIRLVNFTDGCFINDIQVTFIEGTGTSTGLSYENQSYKNRAILCNTKDASTEELYQNAYYPSFSDFLVDSCHYCVSNTSELSKPQFSVFPNPVINEINISSDEYSIDFAIYDVLGNLITFGKTKAQFHTVNAGNLEAGMYILVLKHEDKIISSQRLIKHH